ncbi:MAG: iron-containing alcohol dehydrogenase [Acidobacteriota bacterium]
MIGFRMPTRVHIAPGAASRLPEVARALDLRSVLLVLDPGFREASGAPAEIINALEDTGIRVEVFDAIEPNPRTSTATAAADAVREHSLDGVFALGGGSALDAAKAAAMLATNELRVEQYEGKNRYANAPKPFVAIPTTCGTGSEVTWVSVLTNDTTHIKLSVKGESMFPDQAIVDADLLRTLPPRLVAMTGLDALTHAVECLTCSAANPVSDALATQATVLIFRFIERAVADIEGDDEAREAMARASTLAGLGFGNADVAAVHCLSEAIGGLYDTPHGLTNAVLLAPILRTHQPFVEPQLATLHDALLSPTGAGVAERAEAFMVELEGLCGRLEVPGFASLGVRGEDHGRLAEWAVRNGSNRSNPRPMSPASYREILGRLAAEADPSATDDGQPRG